MEETEEDRKIFEDSNNKLLGLLPPEQMERVFSQERIDIDHTCLCSASIYDYLSKIIPKHFTVIDLGCSYNPQCFFFTQHKQYIGVDLSDCTKFQSDNCIIYKKSLEDFIEQDCNELSHNKEVFVICAYVGVHHLKRISKKFCNVFTYYPSFQTLRPSSFSKFKVNR